MLAEYMQHGVRVTWPGWREPGRWAEPARPAPMAMTWAVEKVFSVILGRAALNAKGLVCRTYVRALTRAPC